MRENYIRCEAVLKSLMRSQYMSVCIHVWAPVPNDFSASGGVNSMERLESFVGVWLWADISCR